MLRWHVAGERETFWRLDMAAKFVLRVPEAGWFKFRDGDNGQDVFTETLADACIFGSEDAAWKYSVAMMERHVGVMCWIYQVSFVRRGTWRRP